MIDVTTETQQSVKSNHLNYSTATGTSPISLQRRGFQSVTARHERTLQTTNIETTKKTSSQYINGCELLNTSQHNHTTTRVKDADMPKRPHETGKVLSITSNIPAATQISIGGDDSVKTLQPAVISTYEKNSLRDCKVLTSIPESNSDIVASYHDSEFIHKKMLSNSIKHSNSTKIHLEESMVSNIPKFPLMSQNDSTQMESHSSWIKIANKLNNSDLLAHNKMLKQQWPMKFLVDSTLPTRQVRTASSNSSKRLSLDDGHLGSHMSIKTFRSRKLSAGVCVGSIAKPNNKEESHKIGSHRSRRSFILSKTTPDQTAKFSSMEKKVMYNVFVCKCT